MINTYIHIFILFNFLRIYMPFSSFCFKLLVRGEYRIFTYFTFSLNKADRLCICNVIRSVVESACSMKSGLRELFLLTFAAFRFPPTFRPSLSYRFFSSTIESRFLSLRSTKSLGTSLIRETKAARLKFVYCSPAASIEFDVILSITTIRPKSIHDFRSPFLSFEFPFPELPLFF